MTPPPRTPTPTTAAPSGGQGVAKPARGWQGWLHPILAHTRAGKGKEVNNRATPATPPPPNHPQQNTHNTTRNSATDPPSPPPLVVPGFARLRGSERPVCRERGKWCNPQRRGGLALLAGLGLDRRVLDELLIERDMRAWPHVSTPRPAGVVSVGVDPSRAGEGSHFLAARFLAHCPLSSGEKLSHASDSLDKDQRSRADPKRRRLRLIPPTGDERAATDAVRAAR